MPTEKVALSFVSSVEAVASLIDAISNLSWGSQPALYIDLEGTKLSREGTISIVSIYVQPLKHVYLVDVHTLREAAFTTPGARLWSGRSLDLKAIFEAQDITKVFFDVRNDSDALYAHYGIRLRGVEDVQLMENACRPDGRRRFLNGLDRCIDQDLHVTRAEKTAWKSVKEKGLALFHPRKGGSYEVFNARPLDPNIERYCINDVVFLPILRAQYLTRLDGAWQIKVAHETINRVRESQEASYQPHREDKAFGPWEQPPKSERHPKAEEEKRIQ
ncbi:hypothetical protein jhhlp_007478 [Lomentospora prolificans]|uniref:3'-5' exonuclease domain-containing protein n=1 Tax=Lomentospora prolificans TaxID=41688 RepID=A0A2N3N171_9PEZI|nr:hypothetical protein jhhlp_007478 [Lomentospora prolificans]